jgi:hypothetical protein
MNASLVCDMWGSKEKCIQSEKKHVVNLRKLLRKNSLKIGRIKKIQFSSEINIKVFIKLHSVD